MKRKEKTENSANPFVIDRHWVREAYGAVKRNKGCAGVDRIDFKRFDKRMADNLYKLWYRMSSGSCENSFVYLGYEYRPREARNCKTGQVFTAFTPAMSKKAVKKIKEKMKSWKLHGKLQWSVERIAEEITLQVRGWYNYYTKFGKIEFWYVMNHLNDKLARWAIRKYKDFKKHPRKAYIWLESLSRRERGMFAHWSLGYQSQCAT